MDRGSAEIAQRPQEAQAALAQLDTVPGRGRRAAEILLAELGAAPPDESSEGASAYPPNRWRSPRSSRAGRPRPPPPTAGPPERIDGRRSSVYAGGGPAGEAPDAPDCPPGPPR